jgi:hypothetical protein
MGKLLGNRSFDTNPEAANGWLLSIPEHLWFQGRFLF